MSSISLTQCVVNISTYECIELFWLFSYGNKNESKAYTHLTNKPIRENI